MNGRSRALYFCRRKRNTLAPVTGTPYIRPFLNFLLVAKEAKRSKKNNQLSSSRQQCTKPHSKGSHAFWRGFRKQLSVALTNTKYKKKQFQRDMHSFHRHNEWFRWHSSLFNYVCPLCHKASDPRKENIIKSILLETSTMLSNANIICYSYSVCCGVRQGDTLSGILFNIIFNSVIQTIYNIGDGVVILAFAYDVLIVADSQEKLEAALDIFSTSCLDIELRINITCFGSLKHPWILWKRRRHT